MEAGFPRLALKNKKAGGASMLPVTRPLEHTSETLPPLKRQINASNNFYQLRKENDMPGAYYLKDHEREPDLTINATTPASTGPLPQGEYTVYCVEGIDFFVTTGAAWGTGNKQRVITGNMPELIVESGDEIWAKSETGTATLEICKVRSNIYY